MIALLGQVRLGGKVLVFHQVRIPLVAFAAEETVITLEAATRGQLRLVEAMFISSLGQQCHLPVM